jgi:hypothetical protein
MGSGVHTLRAGQKTKLPIEFLDHEHQEQTGTVLAEERSRATPEG